MKHLIVLSKCLSLKAKFSQRKVLKMYANGKENFDFDPDLKSSTDLLGSSTQVNSHSREI